MSPQAKRGGGVHHHIGQEDGAGVEDTVSLFRAFCWQGSLRY